MAVTPTRAQARSQYLRQRAVAAGAVIALRRLFTRNAKPSVPQIAAVGGRYQVAAATVSTGIIASYLDDDPLTQATPFLGVSSRGFSLAEPIIATIDRHVPAPAEAVPDAWWDDATEFMTDLEQLFMSEVADAGRSASQVEFVAREEWQNYVRMLTPPSCARCTILAGRIYRDLEAFQRHPQCDCVMVPVQGWEQAHDAGLVASPEQAFRDGQVTGLSEADAQAVRDGADMAQVVNAAQGTTRVGLLGRQVKATTAGTTRRAAWRKANPSLLVRLRPESIYELAQDREDLLRLLRLYGYLTS